MTDITELAQSLRRRAASANEFGEGLFFIKADDVLALLEALDKAQAIVGEYAELMSYMDSTGDYFEFQAMKIRVANGE
ncbi:TPA: hypothetical protein ACWP8A_005985 [Klebsiella pneumoniae]